MNGSRGICLRQCFFFFFFNDTATTEIYTLSLHDALPICWRRSGWRTPRCAPRMPPCKSASATWKPGGGDRKSTRLNSSHDQISYAVFCLKKKKSPQTTLTCPIGECLATVSNMSDCTHIHD